MEDKEALEYLRNHTKYYEPVNREAFRVIEKSLDELEELKKLMGTPIQDIMKRLKILEEIRNSFKVEKEETINKNYYWLIGKKKPHYSYMITKEQYDKWNRWLENDRTKEDIK